MELRQLEAFVEVASQLHFGRAAERLHMGQPTLSDLVRRLEREMGTPLLSRTSRRVTLTSAGSELRQRAEMILGEVTEATAAVRQWAEGDVGTVRLGITPPIAPALPRLLETTLGQEAPGVDLVMRRMWFNDLASALASEELDLAMTCGPMPPDLGVVSEMLCGERFYVGLRSGHRLAGGEAVDPRELARERLGMHSESLFPTWVLAQQHALRAAGVGPTVVEIADVDLSAWRWLSQPDVDWILTTMSASGPAAGAVMLPVAPLRVAPTMLHWVPGREPDAAVKRFVRLALSSELPTGLLRSSQQPRCMKAS